MLKFKIFLIDYYQRRQENAKQVICTFRGYLHLFALLSLCRTKTFFSPQMAQKLSFCLRPTQAYELPGVFLFFFCQG